MTDRIDEDRGAELLRLEPGTEGPWWTDGHYQAQEAGIAVIAARTDAGPLPGNPTRGMVAWASQLQASNADRCEADARLIAASPELLTLARQLAEERDALRAEVACLTAERDAAEDRGDAPAVILPYTNWRGETADRTIVPGKLWFGATEWHPEPGWLVAAYDTEKGAMRDFALSGFLDAAEDRGAEGMRERAAREAEASASIIDHPSVYMGGPSRNAQRLAGAFARQIRALPLRDTPEESGEDG